MEITSDKKKVKHTNTLVESYEWINTKLRFQFIHLI